jgi:hypothetical protein
MGSVVESATTPLDGFNTGFFMCGVIMLVGGVIAMALVNPEREAYRRLRRPATPRLAPQAETEAKKLGTDGFGGGAPRRSFWDSSSNNGFTSGHSAAPPQDRSDWANTAPVCRLSDRLR